MERKNGGKAFNHLKGGRMYEQGKKGKKKNVTWKPRPYFAGIRHKSEEGRSTRGKVAEEKNPEDGELGVVSSVFPRVTKKKRQGLTKSVRGKGTKKKRDSNNRMNGHVALLDGRNNSAKKQGSCL